MIKQMYVREWAKHKNISTHTFNQQPNAKRISNEITCPRFDTVYK